MISATAWMTIILSSMYGIMYLDRVNISIAAKDMMKEFALTNTQLGFAFSAFSWPYLIGQLFGGWFANKIGSRLTLALCGLLVAVSTIATGFVTGLVSLFIMRLLLGIGEGPSFSAATQAMRHWYPEERFGFIQGITHSAARLGGAVAPPIVAWLIGVGSWRLSFWICGLASLLWVVIWLRYFRDDPKDHPGITEMELSKLKPPSKAVRRARTPFGALAKRILPVTAVDFCYGWMLWVFISWIPLYFMKKHGLNLKSSALLAGLTFGAGVIGDTIGGTLSDWMLVKTGNKRLARNAFIAFSLAVSGAFLYATMQTSNITHVALLLGGSFFFLELVVGTIWAIPMDISREYAGLAGGMMNFGFGLAGIISPVVFGFVVDRTGSWDIPFTISVVICVIGALLTVFMRPDRPFIPPHAVGE
ncbi:MAG: MFS transporter [Nitrospirae bacterium]|nr:MFS transporter [Nitrospirota bacterium]